MYSYRNGFGSRYFVPAQESPPTLRSHSQTDWGEVIGRSILVAGGFVLGAALLDVLFGSPAVPRRTAPRDTFRYELWRGSRRVQFGITNDPDRRCSEHVAAGKRFTVMEIVRPAVTRASARTWERGCIEAYARRKGRRPHYNKIS